MTAPVENTNTGENTFAQALEELATRAYHHRHPFNLMMHAGRLSRADLGLWVANRYYYQTRIPIKDALLLAKAEDPRFRRKWVERLHDHDGRDARAGGLALWRRLGLACGRSAAALERFDDVLPAVRRACDDYVELVRAADLLEAVAASLTECFAADLMKARVEAWRRHYAFAGEEALAYFVARITRARHDGLFALDYVTDHARDAAARERCLRAFARKCDILWRILDAVYAASRAPLRPRLDRRASLKPIASEASVAVLSAPEAGLGLNASALELLERFDGDRTLASIVDDLAETHRQPSPVITMDIATFVGELERRRLIVFEGAPV